MRFAMKAAPVLCKRVSTQSRGAYGLTESLCPHTDMPQVSVAAICRTERPAVIPRPSGQRTRSMLGFLAIAVGFTVLQHTSHAQVSIPHDVDTLTSGDSDHLNPSMQHNAFWGPAAKWVVYEHVEGGLTSIRGLQIDWDRLSWDTRVFSISGEYPQGMVRSAEVAGMAFTPVTQWVTAWEQQTDGHWSIWYSARSDTGNAWSPPQDLTPDTVDNTGIQLRPISGYVLATWRRGYDLLACRIGPSGRIDTMGVGRSTSSNFEYDVLIIDDRAGFTWVAQDSIGNEAIFYRYCNFGSQQGPVWTKTESIPIQVSPRNLWFAMPRYFFDGPPIIEFESDSLGRSRVYICSPPYEPEDLSADTTADFGNPCGIFIPIIGSHLDLPSGRPAFIGYGIDIIERRGATDFSFILNADITGQFSDTLSGPGQNRNIVLGSPTPHPDRIEQWYPIVWESNRSGRWHLYGAFLSIGVGDVGPELGLPDGWELSQNYPNPFNPSTTIRYTLPEKSHVTLTVFNTLGQQVATLVEGEQEAGFHEAVFDAKNLASGVYLYRLQAGDFVATRRMVVVR